jgi:ABC-type polysaccharide transport system permease subunit
MSFQYRKRHQTTFRSQMPYMMKVRIIEYVTVSCFVEKQGHFGILRINMCKEQVEYAKQKRIQVRCIKPAL